MKCKTKDCKELGEYSKGGYCDSCQFDLQEKYDCEKDDRLTRGKQVEIFVPVWLLWVGGFVLLLGFLALLFLAYVGFRALSVLGPIRFQGGNMDIFKPQHWGIGATIDEKREAYSYGKPVTQDPYLFCPDYESCSEIEIIYHNLCVNYKKQCEANLRLLKRLDK